MASRHRPRGGDPAVVALLEEMLAAAKRGELREVLVVWTDKEREAWWRFYAFDLDNLVYEARVATAEIRTRTNGERGTREQ
jgi:hypothetical protein